jgi:hypothetical protein
MKKETLEEAAERLVKETTLYGSQEASIGSSARSYFETELRCVLLGMQWQQERRYSEEELKSAFKIGFSIGYGSPVNGLDSKDETCEVWFEQNKKKQDEHSRY